MHQDHVAGARCDCRFAEAKTAHQRERRGDADRAQKAAPVGRCAVTHDYLDAVVLIAVAACLISAATGPGRDT